MRDLEHLKTNLNHQWPPIGAPMNLRREEPWKSQFDDSVNAVSFGFVATAILISMFLVMAIFERLIRTTTTSTTNSDSSSSRVLPGMDSRVGFNGAATKLGYQSPKASTFSLYSSLKIIHRIKFVTHKFLNCRIIVYLLLIKC